MKLRWMLNPALSITDTRASFKKVNKGCSLFLSRVAAFSEGDFMFKWLALLFITVPTAELALLIYSGKTIGLVPTIMIILITGIGGAYLAKRQGVKAWTELTKRMATMETPGNAMIDGVFVLVGGLLLVMPGFITDILGFLLLFPGPRILLRPMIQRWIYRKMKNGSIIVR